MERKSPATRTRDRLWIQKSDHSRLTLIASKLLRRSLPQKFRTFGNFREVGILLSTDSLFFKHLRLVLLLHCPRTGSDAQTRCLGFKDRCMENSLSLL